MKCEKCEAAEGRHAMYCELKPVCQLCVKLETDLELARAELKRLDAELSALRGAKKEGSL
jgi:hypothetical protein